MDNYSIHISLLISGKGTAIVIPDVVREVTKELSISVSDHVVSFNSTAKLLLIASKHYSEKAQTPLWLKYVNVSLRSCQISFSHMQLNNQVYINGLPELFNNNASVAFIFVDLIAHSHAAKAHQNNEIILSNKCEAKRIYLCTHMYSYFSEKKIRPCKTSVGC